MSTRPLLATLTSLSLLLAFGSVLEAQLPTSLELAKTVSASLECGTQTSITVDADSTVYYCYTLTNTGAITMTNATLTDDVLGDPLNSVGLKQCCTASDGDQCNLNACETNAECGGSYPTCVEFTGSCCRYFFVDDPSSGISSCEPSRTCASDSECSANQNCVSDGFHLAPVGYPRDSVFTRVVTATVGADSVVNTAIFTAAAIDEGRCCEPDDPTSCAGVGYKPCSSSADCVPGILTTDGVCTISGDGCFADSGCARCSILNNFCSTASPCASGEGTCIPDTCEPEFPTCTFGGPSGGAPSASATVFVNGDNCPKDPNPGQENGDTDAFGDVCDNCPNDSNPGQEDSDMDGLGDACDNCPDDSNPGQDDGDNDAVGDVCDNCPNDPNPGQEDPDMDGLGDACDNCPNDANPGQEDTDMNGVGDACNDADDPDNDEFENAQDNCPDVNNPGQVNTDGSGLGDACNDAVDADGDEFDDDVDNCRGVANPGQEDSDGIGGGDACDEVQAPALSVPGLGFAVMLLIGLGLVAMRRSRTQLQR